MPQNNEQNIIKEIQRLRNQKLSYQKIADIFNERQINTISGRGKWNKGSIIRLANKALGDIIRDSQCK